MPELVSLSDAREKRELKPLGEAELNRRRLALQIAAQLPADPVQALLVLEATQLLVRAFFGVDGS